MGGQGPPPSSCRSLPLIFYAVLTIYQQVARVLGEPLERISVEMGLRAFYHSSRAYSVVRRMIWCSFWLSMPSSWASSNAGVNITESASNWNPLCGRPLS